MQPNTLRIMLAVILILHGWIHFSLTYVPTPQPGALRTPFFPSWARADTDPAWLASKWGLSNGLVRGLGSALWLLTLAGFSAAGLALLFAPGAQTFWSLSAAVGAAASLLLLAFYWHPWLVAGVLINAAVLAGLLLHFPKILFA